MIVRCPECSTGFKLPKDKITTKGVKLRCSKCSHVFRIRSTDDGDTEIFYTDAEDGPPEGSSDDQEDVVEDSVGSQTQFGMPNVNKDGGDAGSDDAEADSDDAHAEPEEDGEDSGPASRSARPDYNPFPHAGDSIKPKTESRFDSSTAALEQDASEGEPAQTDAGAEADPVANDDIDLFDEDDDGDDLVIEDDPFEGAFDDQDQGGETEKTMQAPGPAAAHNEDSEETSEQDDVEDPAMDETSEAAQKQEADKPQMDEIPTDDDSAFWSQQQETGFGSAEDMVDPEFGEDGAYFDPQQGKMDQPSQNQTSKSQDKPSPGPSSAKSGPPSSKGPRGAKPKSAPPKSSGAASDKSGRDSQKASAQSGSQSSRGEQQSPSTGSANKKTSWDVEQPIEPHTVGGSGMQKVSNFLLITLIVVGLFFAVVAVLAGGVIDFQRLPHTLEVAFQGKDFQPRDAWIPEPPRVTAPPVEDPIRFQGVVGNVVGEGEEQMLAIRGRVKNADSAPYEGVRVRAMLQDVNGRVVTEQEANVGARVSLDDLVAAESVEELQSLMPKQSPSLEPDSSQPFTIVFPKIPARLRKSAELSYKVELASGDPVDGGAEANADE